MATILSQIVDKEDAASKSYKVCGRSADILRKKLQSWACPLNGMRTTGAASPSPFACPEMVGNQMKAVRLLTVDNDCIVTVLGGGIPVVPR
jgi:carbamate kinase